MTAEEKITMMSFLDAAADYLKDGHARTRAAYNFTDDAPEKYTGEGTTLPLAYTEEEPSGFTYTAEAGGYSARSSDAPEKIAGDIAVCRDCELCAGRNKTVPGEGASRPLVMVIGEGPGAEEDASGRPFVGKAGQLLDKMLGSIGLFRDENCYIANVVKCRPPGNRDPEPGEIAACLPFLERQINMLRPRVILCAGRVAAQTLLKTNRGINSLRGEFAEYRLPGPDSGDAHEERIIPVLCTYHPSAVLRDESLKRPAWEDLKLLRSQFAPSGETS